MPNQTSFKLYRVTFTRCRGYEKDYEEYFYRAPSALCVGLMVVADYTGESVSEMIQRMLDDEDLFFDELASHYNEYNNFYIDCLALNDEWLDDGDTLLYNLVIEQCAPDNEYDFVEIPDLPVADVQHLLEPENDAKRVEFFGTLLKSHFDRGSVIPDKFIKQVDDLKFELAVKICEYNE